MCPVVSVMVALRFPFTAVVDSMPSLAALPPNIPTMRPSMPSNLICDFSRVFTSACAGPADNATSGNTNAHAINERFMGPPEISR